MYICTYWWLAVILARRNCYLTPCPLQLLYIAAVLCISLVLFRAAACGKDLVVGAHSLSTGNVCLAVRYACCAW